MGDGEMLDEALALRHMLRFGDRFVCQQCGWSVPVGAVTLAARHLLRNDIDAHAADLTRSC